MIRLFIHWLISAILLLVVAHLVPGFIVSGLKSALIAALVIGLINGTLGLFLKIITFPLTIFTFGLFLLIINAIMLLVASHFVKGFAVNGFLPAFLGALALSILHMLVKWATPKSSR